jgi:hypothetical protein
MIKAPEHGDTFAVGREQTVNRTRNGSTVVYDHGISYAGEINLTFAHVPQPEKDALVAFFNSAGWALNVLAFKDYDGITRKVRLLTPNLSHENAGYLSYDSRINLWNFSLKLIDVTNNPADLEVAFQTMPTALSAHIADLNDPHDPLVTTTVSDADNAKVIDSVSTKSFDGVIWIGVVKLGAAKFNFFVHAVHNGTLSTDATSTGITTETLASVGTLTGCTFTLSLTGAGSSQVMNLLMDSGTNNSVIVSVRKVKLGAVS